MSAALLLAIYSYHIDSLSYNYKLRLFEFQYLIPVVFLWPWFAALVL